MINYFGTPNYFLRQNEVRKLFLTLSGGIFIISCTLSILIYNLSIAEPETFKPTILPEQKEVLIDIFVPKRDILLGERITQDLLEPLKIESTKIGDGISISQEYLLGKYARTLLLAKRPIYNEAITEYTFTNDLREQIPEGYSAVTIKVDKITSFDGWIEPGARVDISSITKIRGEGAIIPVVQNVKIISVERRTQPRKEDNSAPPETITLIALPEEADKISLAQSTGILTLKLLGNHPVKPTAIGKPIKESDLMHEGDSIPTEPDNDGYVTIDGKRYPIRDGRIIITD